MPKVRAYVRIAYNEDSPSFKHRYKVDASARANARPLMSGQGFQTRDLPTVHLAVDFELPDSAFDPQYVGVIEVPIEKLVLSGVVAEEPME